MSRFKHSVTTPYVALALALALIVSAAPTGHTQRKGTPDPAQVPAPEPAGRDEQQDPQDGLAERGQGDEHRADPCDHLPETPGEAQGHDRKCPPLGSSSGIAKGDFNGDTFGDLAVGVPGEDGGAGAVNVIYGGPNGLSAPSLTSPPGSIPYSQFWTQDSTGVPGASENDDKFGSALASGDFNGDTYSDLAIGVPGEDVTRLGINYRDSGGVVVIYGSMNGLTATDPSVPASHFIDFGNDTSGILGGELLGSALAWGDFNGDEVGDLAMGAPGADVIRDGRSVLDTGLAWVIFGTGAAGLASGQDRFINGKVTGDRFGAALTAGKFTRGTVAETDDISDLVIGIPGADSDVAGTASRVENGGRVEVYFGHEDFRQAFSLEFTNAFLTVRGYPVNGTTRASHATEDRFGSVLAVGDFDGDTFDDLAVGVPLREVAGIRNAGVVAVFYGPGLSVIKSADQTWNQNGIFPPSLNNTSESDDFFGSSLAAADFNGDGRDDLAIGVPSESFPRGSQTIVEGGEVDVVYGSGTGLSLSAFVPQMWRQDSFDVADVSEDGDKYGFALTAWNFGRSTHADLAIGVPFEDLQQNASSPLQANAGGVNVLYGSANKLSSVNDQFWSQASPNIPGVLEPGDNFGRALY